MDVTNALNSHFYHSTGSQITTYISLIVYILLT